MIAPTSSTRRTSRRSCGRRRCRVARAYLDQLTRSKAIQPERARAVKAAIDRADSIRTGKEARRGGRAGSARRRWRRSSRRMPPRPSGHDAMRLRSLADDDQGARRRNSADCVTEDHLHGQTTTETGAAVARRAVFSVFFTRHYGATGCTDRHRRFPDGNRRPWFRVDGQEQAARNREQGRQGRAPQGCRARVDQRRSARGGTQGRTGRRKKAQLDQFSGSARRPRPALAA